MCLVVPCHTGFMSTRVGNRQPTISLRINSSEREQIANLARKNDRTPSGEIRRAIRFYLANTDKVEAVLREQAETTS